MLYLMMSTSLTSFKLKFTTFILVPNLFIPPSSYLCVLFCHPMLVCVYVEDHYYRITFCVTLFFMYTETK